MTYHVEGLPRHQLPNHFGYSEMQLAQKKQWLLELGKLYPDVNPLWREWVYYLCANTSEEELEIIKARIDASGPRVPGGGVIQTQEKNPA